MPATLGLWHTSKTHVDRFRRVVAEMAPGVRAVHEVREPLLERVLQAGQVEDEVRAELERDLEEFAQRADVIVCTCSTLGEVAEDLATAIGAPIVRIDRPMARAAVREGGRIAVVASIEGTFASTVRLLEEEARLAGTSPVVATSLVEGAWARFTSGDQAGYLRLVAEHAGKVAAAADVVVLAQASMHGAERFATTQVPVLTSPNVGVRYAVELVSQV